jgi:hypothetical protein
MTVLTVDLETLAVHVDVLDGVPVPSYTEA